MKFGGSASSKSAKGSSPAALGKPHLLFHGSCGCPWPEELEVPTVSLPGVSGWGEAQLTAPLFL
jgi:hypothetical protein